MNGFTMVVLIVLITMIAKVMTVRYRAIAKAEGRTIESADAMRAADEVRQLKERVAVLERLVTENHGSIGLDREIERLRDR